MTALARAFIRIVTFAVFIGVADAAGAQCDVVAVHDAASVVAGRAIDVRVGSSKPRWSPLVTTSFANRTLGFFIRPKELPFELNDERVGHIEAAFKQTLMDVIGGPRRGAADGATEDALVLQTELTGLDPGNRVARTLTATGRAFTAVRAVLTSADGRPLAVVSCDRSTAGGLLGAGGWIALWQSGESLVRKNLRTIALHLARALGRTEEIARKLAARPLKADVAEQRYESRVWKERPPAQWSLKDATRTLCSFMTQTSRPMRGGPPVVTRGVHTLWLTAPALVALERSQTLLADGDESVWLHPFSLAFDQNMFDAVAAEPGYVLAVWPFDKAPFYWTPDAIMASTYVRRKRANDERIAPIALVGPPWPPAIFVFPRTAPDGRPLVESLDTKLELHTTVNGHQVVSHFDVARFGLRDVNELAPPTNDALKHF